jgi:hypothetical protein
LLIIIFAANYYSGGQIAPVKAVAGEFTTWVAMISTMAILYGVVTLIVWRGRTVVSDAPFRDKVSSISFFVVFAIASVAMLLLPGAASNQTFTNYYTLTIGVAATCITALRYAGHFYATYRMFSRVRSIESIALFGSFTLSLLASSSFTVYLWPPMASIGVWIMNVPHVAASRAATISLGIGGVMMGMRALVLKERGIIEAEMR